MKKIILAFIISLALSGCATTTRWEHPTKGHLSNHLDLLHCKQAAKIYADENGYSEDKEFIKDETENCMSKQYGWIKEKDYPIRYYLPFPFNLFAAYF